MKILNIKEILTQKTLTGRSYDVAEEMPDRNVDLSLNISCNTNCTPSEMSLAKPMQLAQLVAFISCQSKQDESDNTAPGNQQLYKVKLRKGKQQDGAFIERKTRVSSAFSEKFDFLPSSIKEIEGSRVQ